MNEPTTGGHIPETNISENNGKNTEYQEYPGGPFKSGNRGKPLGAKNKKKIVDLIAQAVVEKFKAEGKPITEADEEIARVIAEKILSGDINLMKEYWQQKDGKPKQPLVGGDEGDNPISHKITVEFLNGKDNQNTDTTGISEAV